MTAILLAGKVTLVLIVALGLDLALRRRAVLACAAMWNAALVSMALVPAAVLFLPALPLAVFRGNVQAVPAQVATDFAPEQIPKLAHEPSVTDISDHSLADMSAPTGIQEAWLIPSAAWSLAAVYVAGITIGLLWLTVSLIAVLRLRVDSSPLACPVWRARLAHWTNRFQCRPVELRHSDRIQVPLMLGWLRPAIIVPRSMAADVDWNRCDAVLVHELAHVMRGDFSWQMFLRFVQSALWFHPLMWLAVRRIHFTRERACDEFSVHALGGSQLYSETLLEIASCLTRRPSLSLALGVLRTPQIAKRIEALTDSTGNSCCTLPARGRLLALVICMCVSAAIGRAHLVAAQQPDQRAEKSATEQADGREPAKTSNQTKDAPRTMQVLVLGPDDKPLAGAKIHISLWTNEPFDKNRDFICDEEGKVKFELPRQIEILRLWARHQGHVGMFAQWWPEMEAKPREIPADYTYRLEKGTKIGGVVKNADGQPISGARVEARLDGLKGQAEKEQLEVRAIPNMWLAERDAPKTTDAQGRWSFDNVPAGDDVEVQVMLSHPDYISESRWGGLQKEAGVTMRSLRDGSGTIVMQRGVSVSGRVMDPDRKPVAKAIVVWGDDPYFEWGSQEVRTDADGKYRLPPRATGPLTLTVIAEGWAPDQRKIDLAPANSTADFQLKRGRTTRIRVVDESGAAIPEVSIGIDGWRGNKALYNAVHPNVLTTKIPNKADRNGIYEWTWSPGEAVSYYSYKEGYAQVSFAAGEGEHLITMRRK